MELQPLDILKWFGLALAAGFVGYFGRYPAKLLLEKMHKKKVGQTTSVKADVYQPGLEESRLKMEKKRAKQEAKKAKKQGRQ